MNIEKAEFLIEQMLQGTWHLVKTADGSAVITPEPTDTVVATIEGGNPHTRILVTVSRLPNDEFIGRTMSLEEACTG
jgi:hypothetical protein